MKPPEMSDGTLFLDNNVGNKVVSVLRVSDFHGAHPYDLMMLFMAVLRSITR